MNHWTIILLSFCLCGTVAFSQTKSSQKPRKTISSRKDDNCMLKPVYGKRLEFAAHEEAKKTVQHTNQDYIQFDENGTYIEFIGGNTNTGTWSFDPETNTIIVNCVGTHIWIVETNEDGTFSFTKSNETRQLKIKK